MGRTFSSNIGCWIVALLLAALPASAERRALLIGINAYSAGDEPAISAQKSKQGRTSWTNLYGAVNDATAMREMLISRYGFTEDNAVLLVDQEATRAAILKAIDEHLIKPSKEGDHAVLFFAGHGSRVMNSKSDEADLLDETRVPADARKGARDIRDKELRKRFNRILDRGARLTVILDSCYSGSGARGLPREARARGLEPDPRDVADGADYGPVPEDRGALVLSASQDFERAWETWDEARAQDRGAFSLALMQALRAAGPRESAAYVFQRAEAAIRLDKAPQYPVLAGDEAARSRPLFGGRVDHRAGKTVVAVGEVARDGKTVTLRGGWANGLTVDSELRLFGDTTRDVELRVIAIEGLSSSIAEIVNPDPAAARETLRPGTLLELSGWASPPGRPLLVWIPEAGEATRDLARQVEEQARRKGVEWIADPVKETPSHVLSWQGEAWCLQGPAGDCANLGAAPVASKVIASLPGDARLFVHLPAPPELVRGIEIGPKTENDAVERTADPLRADYFLTGRLAEGRGEYAWVRPLAVQADQARSPLPLRTDWHAVSDRAPAGRLPAAVGLEDAALLLAKLRAWLSLESPPGGDFSYRLALGAADGSLRTEGTLRQGERYGLVLRRREGLPESHEPPRYVYVFVIDSSGGSTLLFPPSGQGNVENRFPNGSAGGEPTAEIVLGPSPLFEVSPPFGMDTYFLLTSREPIPNPWVLQYPGVRTRGPKGTTALEELLSVTGGSTRGTRLLTPMTWSIERLSFESVKAP